MLIDIKPNIRAAYWGLNVLVRYKSKNWLFFRNGIMKVKSKKVRVRAAKDDLTKFLLEYFGM